MIAKADDCATEDRRQRVCLFQPTLNQMLSNRLLTTARGIHKQWPLPLASKFNLTVSRLQTDAAKMIRDLTAQVGLTLKRAERQGISALSIAICFEISDSNDARSSQEYSERIAPSHSTDHQTSEVGLPTT